MRLKNRLEKLERSPEAKHHTGAREELIRRLEHADPDTRERVRRALREKVEGGS